jgi:ubiquinone/menaquinone biosynthesis C-methylase UbiE
MYPRTLEPELMDTAEDAREYDAMDHAAVNECFVTDLLAAIGSRAAADLAILDVGAGTGLIPIELCRRASAVHVVAVDAAAQMLAIARQNVAAAGFVNRIELVPGDAKKLQFDAGAFPAVVSNSIIHHIADPRPVIAEAIRITAPGGLLFHRDLCRPGSEAEVGRLVSTYAAGATAYQQKLLADSLRAALTLEEIRGLICEFGFRPETVQMNSDRHWTWVARRNKLM